MQPHRYKGENKHLKKVKNVVLMLVCIMPLSMPKLSSSVNNKLRWISNHPNVFFDSITPWYAYIDLPKAATIY